MQTVDDLKVYLRREWIRVVFTAIVILLGLVVFRYLIKIGEQLFGLSANVERVEKTAGSIGVLVGETEKRATEVNNTANIILKKLLPGKYEEAQIVISTSGVELQARRGEEKVYRMLTSGPLSFQEMLSQFESRDAYLNLLANSDPGLMKPELKCLSVFPRLTSLNADRVANALSEFMVSRINSLQESNELFDEWGVIYCQSNSMLALAINEYGRLEFDLVNSNGQKPSELAGALLPSIQRSIRNRGIIVLAGFGNYQELREIRAVDDSKDPLRDLASGHPRFVLLPSEDAKLVQDLRNLIDFLRQSSNSSEASRFYLVPEIQ